MVQRVVVQILARVMARLEVPDNISLGAARADIAATGANTVADFNHFYRSRAAGEEKAEISCDGAHCIALRQIAWPLNGNTALACATQISAIGMVDTGINANHDVLSGQKIELLQLSMPGEQKSGLQHGTAVAALLIGRENTRTPGLLPDAELVAVDVFHRSGGDERADIFSIVHAFDTLQQRGIKLVNMSLAGPPNALLETMTDELSNNGVIIVAAAGNEGPNAAPAFPAAYPSVVAVTAIDASGGIYIAAPTKAGISTLPLPA